MNLWKIPRPLLTVLLTGGWLAIALGPLSTSSSTAWAQKPKADSAKSKNDKNDKNAKSDPASQPTVTMEIAKAAGKLEGAQLAILKISTSDNKELFLRTDNDSVVHYTAEAEPVWLTPGVFVRFTASFDQSGKATAALKDLEVFSPIMSGRLSPEQQREQTPGIHQEGKAPPEGAKGLFSEKNKPAPANNAPKGKPANKKEPPAPMPGQAFRVVGKLAGVQNNVLTVIAGRPIQIELDAAAKITVTAHDLPSAMSMAAKGDAVEVSGLRNPAQPEMIVAEQLDIKAAKKLTQAVQPKRGKSPARDKDGDSKDKDPKDKVDAKKSAANKAAPDKKSPK